MEGSRKILDAKNDTPVDVNSSLSLHSLTKDSMSQHLPKLTQESDVPEDKENVGDNTSSSLTLQSVGRSPMISSKQVSKNVGTSVVTNFNMDKILPKVFSQESLGGEYDTPTSTQSSLSMHSLNNGLVQQPLQKIKRASGGKSINKTIPTPKCPNKASEISRQVRHISFTIKGQAWANSRFGPHEKAKNVVFAKMGNLAPRESLQKQKHQLLGIYENYWKPQAPAFGNPLKSLGINKKPTT